jgi:3D-(3,5/4)-trihydroxycyclohexane-1,2-dione acylhydrolase (decyclizing)
MTVGGSKGSISGNFAMNEADLAIIIGARAVCQWDCSGTAWKKARHVINFNMEVQHAGHYNRTVAVVGDARRNLVQWIDVLRRRGRKEADGSSEWARLLAARKAEWENYKKARYATAALHDETWGMRVLTQPAAIKAACDFADSHGVVKLFDAGDVQANGFQVVQDEREGMTLTDTGSSYMGFAVSALMASAMASEPFYGMAFSGDGSFMMNPQVLLDGVLHGVQGCIVIFDNRRMGAITGLQCAQYGTEYGTWDKVEVDYSAMAGSVKGVKALHGGTSVEEFVKALGEARAYKGLSVVHVPVYFGPDENGGLGVFGHWNIGNWCERVQAEHHRIGL